MSGINIGIGVGLRYSTPSMTAAIAYQQDEKSCFGSGVWINSNPFIYNDIWEMGEGK